jgi:hypothetical protein
MRNFFIKKRTKIQNFMDKTLYIFGTLPFSPWAISTTWLHQGTPQKLQ